MEIGTPREDQSQQDGTAQNQLAHRGMTHQGSRHLARGSGSSLGADGGAQDGEGLRLELQDAHAAPGARAPQPRRPVRAGARHQASALHGGPQRLQLGARRGPSVPVALLQGNIEGCCTSKSQCRPACATLSRTPATSAGRSLRRQHAHWFLHRDTDRCCRTTAVHISAMTIICISVEDPRDLGWRRA